jgi:hypothetical protein
MRKSKIVIIICVFAVLSCLKDETKSHDVYTYNNYDVYLDSSKRIVKYLKTIENGATVETHLFIFDTISVTYKVLDQNDVLLEKVVYSLNDKGYAVSSVDTVIIGDEMVIFNLNYTYESDFLVEINGIEKDFDYAVLTDSTAYSIHNFIENDNVIKSVRTFDTTCTVYYTYNNLDASIDVISWTNTLFGKTNKNLIEFITYYPDCLCSQSADPATSLFDYEIDAGKRITKSVETYTPCGSNQNYKLVSTSTYRYLSI